MTATRPFPRRVASPAFAPTPTKPPRLWPNLPAATQVQLAQLLAQLLRRQPPTRSPAIEESPRDDRLEQS
jgi:hypothetical protein